MIPPPSLHREELPSYELETTETLISRLPFPQGEVMPSHDELENAEVTTSRPYSLMKKEMIPTPDDNRASDEDSLNESTDEGDSRSTVRRMRARSLDSARKRLRNKKFIYLETKTLSTEQEKAVNTATSLLTQEQKESMQRHQNVVVTQHEKASPNDMDPGPSRKKGKAFDPREWGNAGINPEEMNIKIQEAIFDAYQRGRKEANLEKDNNKSNDRNGNVPNEGNFKIPAVARHKSVASLNNAQSLESQRANSRPAAQLVPDSSLGAALGNIARMVEGPYDSDDPYDNSSDYDSSVYSRSTRSRGSSRSRQRCRRHSKQRSNKRSRQCGQKRTKSSIKPIPPKGYDGAADVRAYHRFVMEGEAYLRDGKVQRERQIRILAHHLDGKAYQFYMQKIASDDPTNWNLHKFFMELFNFCFPVDYRQQMRVKLEIFYQKRGQTVSEFVFELQELFSMVGAMPEEMKVIKLWYSLNSRTQHAMWRDGLHPDSSSWDEVVAKAEIIEIADSVVDRQDESGRNTWRLNISDSSYRQSHDSASASQSLEVEHKNQYRDDSRRAHHSNQGDSSALR